MEEYIRRNAIDSWIVLDRSHSKRLIGYIKGCSHPYPYLFVAPRNSSQHIIWRHEKCVGGLRAPLIYLKSRALSVVEPPLLSHARKKCNTRVCLEAGILHDLLVSAGIEDETLRVTGSLALEEKASDIDIVLYGSRAASKAYKALIDLRAEGKLKPFIGLGREWGQKDIELHSILAERRVLFGVVDKVPYSIRMVACTSPTHCIPYRILGSLIARAVIVDAMFSYFTPAFYRVKLLEVHKFIAFNDMDIDIQSLIPREVYMLTHRLRFTEIPSNTIIELKGLLEDHEGMFVISPDHGGFIRILLEE